MIFESIWPLYLEHGGFVAGSQAGNCFKRQETIGSRLTNIKTEPVTDSFHEFFRTAQCTRNNAE